MVKKIFTILFTITLLLESTAFINADDTVYTENGFYYTLNDESISIIGYFAKDTDVYIPSMIAGYPVNAIKSGSFVDTKAVNVYIPSTVQTIEEGAIGEGVSCFFERKNNTDNNDDNQNNSHSYIGIDQFLDNKPNYENENNNSENIEEIVIEVDDEDYSIDNSNELVDIEEDISNNDVKDKDEKTESSQIIENVENKIENIVEEVKNPESNNGKIMILSFIGMFTIIAIIIVVILKHKNERK